MAGLSVTVHIEGDIASAGPKLRAAAGQGLREGGERVMDVSKAVRCPVDTGALRSTGHVTGPDGGGDQLSVDLNYGGPAAPYAWIVHERMGVRHPVGGPKYLEGPANEMSGDVADLVAAAVRRAF